MSFIHPGNVTEHLPWATSSAEDTKKEIIIIFIIDHPNSNVIELILAGVMLSTLHAFSVSSVKCSTPGRQFFFFLHTPVGGALVT